MLLKNSEQHCLRAGDKCDWCSSEEVTFEERYAMVAQGATGRYCEVMWICDDCGNKQEGEVLTVEAARDYCDAQPNAYADF